MNSYEARHGQRQQQKHEQVLFRAEVKPGCIFVITTFWCTVRVICYNNPDSEVWCPE